MDLERQLDQLETELATRLASDLPSVAAGHDSLYFYNADHNPSGFSSNKLSRRGSEAYLLACEIRDLRARLELDSGCLAAVFIETVRDHADASNPHRLGPKRLAAWLAEQLTPNSGKAG